MPLGPEIRRMEAFLRKGTLNFDGCSIPKVDVDADARMAALRPDLYVLAGLITPFAVRRLFSLTATYPPYGLPKNTEDEKGAISWELISSDPTERDYSSWQNVRSFQSIFVGLRNAAKLAAKDFTLPVEYTPVADRYINLVREAHEIEPDQSRYNSGRDFMLAGLNTAIEMSVGAQAGIHALATVERQATSRQNFVDISGRSSRLATVIALVNVDHTGGVRRAVQSHDHTKPSDANSLPYFNPNVLQFYPDPNAPDAYVDYTKPLEQLIDPLTGKKIGDLPVRFDTLTCPGLASIKGLWNHITNLSADAKFGRS